MATLPGSYSSDASASQQLGQDLHKIEIFNKVAVWFLSGLFISGALTVTVYFLVAFFKSVQV